MPAISHYLKETSHLFIALTETWLNDHLNAELHIQDFSLCRQDRQRKRKKFGCDSGGVAFYIRDEEAINSEVTFNFSNGVIEALGIHLKLRNLIAITIYPQPDDQQKKHRSTCAEFKQLTQALSNYLMELPSPTLDLIICGDLNLPHADWENGKCQPGATKDEQQMVQELHTLTTKNFMVQYVDEPTHRDGNTLDLLFSNNSDLVHSFTSAHSLLSDHHMIEFKAVYKQNTSYQEEKEAENENEAPKPNQLSFRNFNFFSDEINWESINHAFSNYNWWRDFKGCTPDAMMKKFCAICLATVPDYVPPRSKAQSSSNKIPRHRRILMRTRRRINIQLSKAPPEERRHALRKQLMEIEKKLQYSYHSQTAAREKAVDSIQRNPKYFFSKIKIGRPSD